MGPGHAITKIRATKGENLKPLLEYINNPEKTTLAVEFEGGDESASEGFGSTIQLTSGINCNVNTAQVEFDLAREKYLDVKKERLRPGERASVAYHLIQSFEGSDYDPKFIHEIGKEFAKELLGDNFQCVVSTHINTENYHNHIVFNAYSMNGPYKYHDKKATVAIMKHINDNICKKYGLEIIIDPDMGKSHSYKEYLEIKNGTSWKEQIRSDIKATMEISTNFDEFLEYMKSIGYEIKENESSITYTMGENSVRDIKLGREFTREELEKYWEQDKSKEIKEKLDKMVEVHERKTSLYVSKYDFNGRKRSLIEMMFLKAIKILKKLGELLTLEEDIKRNNQKIQGLVDAMQKASDLGIGSREELLDKISVVGKELSTLKAENAAYGNLLDNLNEIYENVSNYDSLKERVVALGINPNHLEVKQYSEEEIRINRAKINPMTPDQRRILFNLVENEKYYKLDCKFDEISRFEANQVINFLNKKSSEKPAILITQEEFSMKRLIKMYDKAKEKRLEALKSKFGNVPLNEKERKEIAILLKDRDIDVLSLTKYDYLRIKNHLNRENPLLTPSNSGEPISEQIKMQLKDLLLIYPEHNIDNIRDNLDSLDNQTAKRLYNFLLEEGLIPEALSIDRESRYEEVVGELSIEDMDLCNQYRYVAEMAASYGIEDIGAFIDEIYTTKEELEQKKSHYESVGELYGELQFIKRNESYIQQDKFLYGEELSKEDVEIKEVERASREEEEYIKPKKETKSRGIGF